MKVLQVCHKMPNPPLDGGSQVMHFTTLGLIANQVEVKVVAINPTRNRIDLDQLSEDYKRMTKLETVTVDTAIRPLDAFLNLFRSESYFTERFNSTQLEKKMQTVLESEHFDIVQLEHLYVCKLIPVIRKHSRAKIIFRPQNIEFVIWERYLKGVKNPFKHLFLQIATQRLKRFENSIPGKVDGILPLTREDADLFHTFSTSTPMVVVPMGYYSARLSHYDFELQYKTEPVAYHLGSMDWLPNVEAVRWFLEEVVPEMEKTGIPVRLSIAGKSMPSWVYSYSSEKVEIMGEVTDPLGYQEGKPVMIIPLWSGSGIRAKIVEGLALGKTIVSTTIGAQGIEYENGVNILIADTPQDFARQVIRCCTEPELCRTIGTNAQKLSREKYDYLNTAKQMIRFYHQILNING